MAETVLITGAAGRVAGQLRPRLSRSGRVLRLLDERPVADPAPGEQVITGDITDPDTMLAACAGADAVIHLGGIAIEDEWERLLHVNVTGTRIVLDAAQRTGVPRVLLASSIHAAGYYRRPGTTGAPAGIPAQLEPDGLPACVPPRPDTFYGLTKAAVEGLGSLYADRYGLTVVAVRLGACFPVPVTDEVLESWFSPADCARLMEAFLTTEATGYHLIWGVSRNEARWWSLTGAAAIGFDPQDDSSRYDGPVPPAPAATRATEGLLGRSFVTLTLGIRPGS